MCIRDRGRIELPGRRGLCHLAAIGGVLYGSCYESGHFFALDLELTRVLWEYLPEGTPRAHWAQEMDGVLYLADLGNDRVYRFSLENGLPSGAPQPIRLPAGSGPRQPLSLGGGSFAVVCELDGMLRFFSRDGACLAELCASGRTGDNAPGLSLIHIFQDRKIPAGVFFRECGGSTRRHFPGGSPRGPVPDQRGSGWKAGGPLC